MCIHGFKFWYVPIPDSISTQNIPDAQTQKYTSAEMYTDIVVFKTGRYCLYQWYGPVSKTLWVCPIAWIDSAFKLVSKL